jgi:hypothetical protein
VKECKPLKIGTSGNSNDSSEGIGLPHEERSRQQPHPQQMVRFVPDARAAPREATTAARVSRGRTNPTGNTSPTTRMWR